MFFVFKIKKQSFYVCLCLLILFAFVVAMPFSADARVSLSELQQQVESLELVVDDQQSQINDLSGEPKTIYVPDDYDSIADAVNAAMEGDTIIISASTFSIAEPIVFKKSNIKLTGVNKDTSIIQASTSDINVIEIENAQGIEILNITIQNGSNGIYARYSSLKCSDCNIFNNSSAGIEVRYNSYLSVENTILENNGNGVRYRRDSSGFIQNCEVKNNSGRGVALDNNAIVIIMNTKVNNNGSIGAQAWLGSSITLQDSEVKDNALGGLDITGNSTGNSWGGNIISGNADGSGWRAGIGIVHNSFFQTEATDEIFQNNGPGVNVSNNSTAFINGSPIYGNQGDGININGDSIAQFENGASIASNDGYGINCQNGSIQGDPNNFANNQMGDENNCFPIEVINSQIADIYNQIDSLNTNSTYAICTSNSTTSSQECSCGNATQISKVVATACTATSATGSCTGSGYVMPGIGEADGTCCVCRPND